MTMEDRKRQVRIHGYCGNCLARSHQTDDCTSADVCQKCGWAHHTLLHQPPRRSLSPEHADHQRNNRSVHDRLGSVRSSRQQRRTRATKINHRSRKAHRSSTNHSPRGSSHRSSRVPATSPKRILLGAVRALERLAQVI